MGATKAVCQAPFVFAETLAISGIQPIIGFFFAATLCENGGTSDVMVRSKDIFAPTIVPHLISEVDRTEVSKVQPELSMRLWPNFMTF
jgi:hypothetical protein